MTLTLDIAGVTFAIDLPSAAWQAPIAERYGTFLGGSAPAWHVTVNHDPALPVIDEPWVRHDGPVTTYRFSYDGGRIDLAARRAELSVRTEARVGALDRALTYICMQALPREHDGLLLHAAGVVLDGAGHVFAGASAAGKTTIAGLAAGRGEVLTDETVILRLGVAGPELFGTPFWGQSTPPELIRRTNRRVPLAAIYLLAQATDFRLTPLAPAEAAVALLSTEKVATERTDSADAWLAAAGRLLAAVPCYRLEFRPDPELWDFLVQAGTLHAVQERTGSGAAVRRAANLSLEAIEAEQSS